MAKKKKSVEETEDLKTPKALSPFDIITMMFTNYEQFNNLSDTILEKNFFMINRVFSIKYPLHSCMFNNEYVNKASVIRSWAIFGVNKEGFGKVPSFVYTKGAKRSTTSTNKDKLDKGLIQEYCKRYSISLKDYNALLSLYTDELITDIKRYEKLISLKEQSKNIK